MSRDCSEVEDWPTWASSLPDLTRTQRHVLRALCELCDERGTLVISTRQLIGHLALHRATLFRTLASLEAAGLIRREQRRDHRGALAPTRFQLLRHVAHEADEIPPAPERAPVAPAQWGHHEGLSALISHLEACNWRDIPAREALAQSLREASGRWFGMVSTRVIGALDITDLSAEIPGVAWKFCRLEARSLVDARRSWHLLSVMIIRHYTSQASAQVEVRSTHSSLSVDELNEFTPCERVRTLSGDTMVIGIEDVDDSPTLSRVRDALVAAGMSPAVASPAVARAATLAATLDETRVDAVARRDATLVRLGVGGGVATDMVALIRGRRRHPEEAGIHLTDAELAARCEAITNTLPVRKIS